MKQDNIIRQLEDNLRQANLKNFELETSLLNAQEALRSDIAEMCNQRDRLRRQVNDLLESVKAKDAALAEKDSALLAWREWQKDADRQRSEMLSTLRDRNAKIRSLEEQNALQQETVKKLGEQVGNVHPLPGIDAAVRRHRDELLRKVAELEAKVREQTSQIVKMAAAEEEREQPAFGLENSVLVNKWFFADLKRSRQELKKKLDEALSANRCLLDSSDTPARREFVKNLTRQRDSAQAQLNAALEANKALVDELSRCRCVRVDPICPCDICRIRRGD